VLNHARRATLALTTSAMLTVGLAAPAAQAAPADITPQSAAAARWLASQLDEGLVVSEYKDFETDEWVAYTDYGLTLDFYYAFDGLGVKPAVRKAILDAIEPEVEDYIAPFGTTYAGAVGKLLTAVQIQGIDPASYGANDLLEQLEGLVHTADDSELGRAEDAPSDDETDTSNTVGQSFVVRALAGADSELADETVAFLLKQQCDKGFFRVYMESTDHTCEGGTTEESGPSVDATAAGLQALVVARESGITGLGDDIRDAVAWLVAKQAKNGSFSDGGVPNSNSTGLAAQALAELGKNRPAARAAAWIDKLRVTKRMIARTDFKPADKGAVAFGKAALAEGKEKGITRDARYVWRRSAAQAAVGLNSLGQ
jgi:hypothetical protein